MRKYIFIGLLLVMCIVNSCITARCHGYDLNNYRYISFRLGDTLTYASNKSDTIHLVVIDFFSRGYYEFKAPPDYECNLDTYYQTDTRQGISIKEHIMYITGARFCNDKAYLRDDEPKDDCEKEESDTVINGFSYRKYVVRDISGERRIDRYIKLDYQGIIEFHDKSTGLTWKQIW